MTDLKTAAAHLDNAKTPEDVFGPLDPPERRIEELRSKYLDLVEIVHPDHHGGLVIADKAMASLNRWRDLAEEKIKAGKWGQPTSTTTIQAGNLYIDVEPMCAGDICDLYLGSYGADGKAVIKIARDPRDRDLVENECKTLARLHAKPDKESVHFSKYIPTFIEATRIKNGNKERAATIITHVSGGYTLAQVMKRYSDGLDARHVAWIWKRLLECLDWVHRKGIVHGAITPDHILILPENHGVKLLDWSYATEPGGKIKAIPASWRHIYPREILDKLPATTGVDLYMVAKCVELMLGAVQPWPRLYAGMIHASTLPAGHRYQNAFEVYEQLDHHLRTMYGKPKFVELTM